MGKTMKVEYRISFYEPDSQRECMDFDAETPFGAVHVGDGVTGYTWKDSAYPTDPKHHMAVVAEVTSVERSVAIIGDVIHDITLVHTKAVEPRPPGDKTEADLRASMDRAKALNKL